MTSGTLWTVNTSSATVQNPKTDVLTTAANSHSVSQRWNCRTWFWRSDLGCDCSL